MFHYVRLRILLLVLPAIFLLGIMQAGDLQNYTDSETDSLNVDETYPDDINLLEEIIQSYYLLLDTQAGLDQYSMLNLADNVIRNDSPTLSGFYAKLAELRNGQRDRVSILQIGDSHIQSGYFSGTARSSLQRYFGNAGRGLVFPWRLAHTNQPDDIRITSDSAWQRSSDAIGISGYGLQAQSSGNLVIQTNDFFQTDNTFDQLTLIMKEKDNSYAWDIPALDDELDNSVSAFADQSIYQLSWVNPCNRVELNYKADTATDNMNLYGIILERQQPGLFFHSMGANGASFNSMVKIREFFPQMRILAPDLIIVSLGTNDVQGSFRSNDYLNSVKQFMSLLRTNLPGVPVLFTLPPDSYKNGDTNNDLDRASALLCKYARDNRYAWWDLRAVMGGAGSIRTWRNAGLATSDYKHFSPKGYMLQGHLFQQALIKGYNNYLEQH